MSSSAARMSLRSARGNLESGRYDDANSALDKAFGLIAELPADEAAGILAEITMLRALVADAAGAEEAERLIKAARRQLKRVESDIEAGHSAEDVEKTIRVAEKYLDEVADVHKAAVVAEIAALRAGIGGAAPALAAAASPVRTPEPAAAVEPAADDRVALSRAKSLLSNAASLIGSNRTDGVGESLDEAARLLAGVADAQRRPLLDRVRSIRADLSRAVGAEHARRIEGELNAQLRTGEQIDYRSTEDTGVALSRATRRLADENVRRYLPAETFERLEVRLATAVANRLAAIKSAALDGALSLLEELEQRVADDPFAGLDESAAYRVMSELQSLKRGVYGRLWGVAYDWNATTAADDPDVAAIDTRVAVVDRTIETASSAWGTALQVAKVESRWAADMPAADWEDETFEYDPLHPFATPEMPKTRAAVRTTRWLLDDAEMNQIRRAHPDHPAILAAFGEAHRVHEAAMARMAGVFHSVLDEAGGLPTPIQPHARLEPGLFKANAHDWFDNTPHHGQIVSRTQALIDRFDVEYAAILTALRELWDRLVAESDAVWPSIVASTGANADIDPTAGDAKGRIVLLRNVVNRSGWEYDGYGFAMSWDGTPLGGYYEPHVGGALDYAADELKFGQAGGSEAPTVDRLGWDVIAVVDGPGKIKERTTITRYDKSTGEKIGEEVQWLPIDCVQLTIIALHAGPIAVGPDHDWAPTL